MVPRLLRPPARLVGARRLVFMTILCAVIVGTLMLVVLVAGLAINDRGIAVDGRQASATVLAVSAVRTDIEFINEHGQAVRPRHGVLYPGKLKPGQRILVEYRASNPQVVRVAGRNMGVAWPGIIGAAALLYLVTIPALVVLVRWPRSVSVDAGAHGAVEANH